MPLDIAIIGAGVGGLTLAVALQKNPNLRVNLYERASELKEVGKTSPSPEARADCP